MVDHALLYFVTLALVVGISPMVPARFRRALLLMASLCFYAFVERRWAVLAFVIATTFAGAHLLARVRGRPRASWILAGVLVCVFGPLFMTKYVEGVLPLGVSFFTFFAIGYLIDVYRDPRSGPRGLADVATGVSLFPLLTAGPIERSGRLFPQLEELPGFEYGRWRDGGRLIALGLFKKLVIADTLAPSVVAAFQAPASLSGYSLYLVAVMARYQIFADFSGYTDIARGSALLMGLRVMENFNRPFAGRSITDHWRRWHISLSSWMRDYVFLPLVASPLWRLGLYGNVIVTFVLLGLWHGPTLNFLFYGLLQGVLIALHDGTRRWRERLPKIFPPRLHHAWQVAFTFLVLVSLPTIFFFARDAGDSALIFTKIFTAPFERAPDGRDLEFLGSSWRWPAILLVIAGLEIAQWAFTRPWARSLEEWPAPWRWGFYALVGLVFALLGNFGAPHDFIYRHF